MKVSKAMLEQAAEARARGLSWLGVGKTVNRSAERVRKWPREYPRRWFAALKHYEDDILQNAAAESVNTLRNQLRVDDEQMKQTAAVNLLRHESRRKPPPAKVRPPRPVSATAVRMAEYVESLSDDDLAKLLAETDRLPPVPAPTDRSTGRPVTPPTAAATESQPPAAFEVSLPC